MMASTIESFKSDTSSLIGSLNPRQATKIQTCLSGLLAVTEKLRIVLDTGMAALRPAAVKPRIKPWIDAFVMVPHNITEEQFAEYEANDPFVQGLIVNLDGLLNAFKVGLTAGNYERFVTLVAGEVTFQLERAVFKSCFSRLGRLNVLILE